MAKIEVTLSHFKNSRKKFPFIIEVENTSIADRWLTALQELLEHEFFLKKDFCFMGFPDSPEGIEYWLRKLKKYVAEINSFSREGVWKNGYRINVNYSRTDIFHKGRYKPEPMWAVHHDFELLTGQRWALSPFYMEATPRIKYCILQVNDVLHQIEWLGRMMEQRLKDPHAVAPYTMFSFTAPMFPFRKSDQRFFEIDQGKFGGVYIKYAQLGKNHWEAFIEGDTEIFKSNVSGLQAFTGQFIVEWGHGMSAEDLAEKKKAFRAWLRKNGWSPNDPRLALGRIKVGQVKKSSFKGMEIPEIHRLLAEYSNVQKITISSKNGTISKEFPISIRDRHYDRVQSAQTLTDNFKALLWSEVRGVSWIPRKEKRFPKALRLQQ